MKVTNLIKGPNLNNIGNKIKDSLTIKILAYSLTGGLVLASLTCSNSNKSSYITPAGTVGKCIKFEPYLGYVTCVMSKPQIEIIESGITTNNFKLQLKQLAFLPTSINHEDYIENNCPPVLDQGQCGWCVAFATTAAMEAISCQKDQSVSIPDLWYLGRGDVENCPGGWNIINAANTAENNFIVPSSLWSYSTIPGDSSTTGMSKTEPPDQTLKEDGKYSIASYITVPSNDINSIKQALAQGYNVVYGVPVFCNVGWEEEQNSLFSSYGNITSPPFLSENTSSAPVAMDECKSDSSCNEPGDSTYCERGSHAILLIGYDDATSSFTFRNSWGAAWGFSGYGTISYDYIQNFGQGGVVLTALRSFPQSSTIPSPPTNLIATPGNGQVALSWSASTNAEGYYISYSTISGGPYGNGEATTATGYTVLGLVNGKTYYFVVSAYNSEGVGNISNEVSATPQASITIPSPPTNLTAVAGNGQVALTWNTSSGAQSYNIYESTVSGGPYNSVGPTSNLSYTVTGLTNGTTYYFVVTAVNSAGQSNYSNQASAAPTTAPTPPAPPTNLTANPGNGQVSLAWNASSGALSYNVYWSTSSGVTTANGTKVTGVTSPYLHTGLTNGTTYYYIVTAVNTYGESGASNQASATPTSAPTPPAPPTNLAAVAGNAQVSLTWTASSGANYYDVYDSATNGGPYNYVNQTTNISYTVTGLQNWKTYYFVVTAVNSAGQSNYSNQASATPNITYTFPVGTNPEAIAVDNASTLWVANAGDNTVMHINSSGSLIKKYTGFSSPVAIAIDASNEVWVANYGNGTVINMLSGLTYSVGGSNPEAIAVDASGNVWTANYGSNSVTELNSSGTILNTYAVGSHPDALAIDVAGYIWVANEGTNTVTEISNGSTSTHTVGNAPDAIAMDQNAFIWVTNWSDNTLMELYNNGSQAATYSVGGSEPAGIAVDHSGNIWVTNFNSNTVTELNSSGTVLSTLNVGTGPIGIAIDPSGNIWVTNKNSNNITELSGITTGPQYFPYTNQVWPW